MVDATHAGVLFTRDPMGSGEPVIEAVRGRGDVVVAGAATPDDGALSSDDRAEVLALGRRVESLFGGPQDVEWAFDADGRLWLLQSRPITAGPDDVVDGTPAALPDAVVLRGLGASPGVASGPVRILRSAEDGDRLGDGEVLVATTTSPAWVPAMVDAAAIVTDIGGITSHAAIVARELGVPCVVGTVDATRLLADGDVVAVDGSRGLVSRASAPDADG
jgi:pyruvate,water dikinase